MAGTPEIALNMLMRAWKSLEDPTTRDIAKMQAIANAEGADFELQPWDRLYYTEKLKQQEFNFNTGDVLPYFELNNIVAAMTWAAGQVYEFEFRELHDVAVVSPDIRVFEVLRGGEVTGVIWMDLFAREGKGPSSWAAQYRSEENFRGKQIPLVVLHSAAQKPPDGGPVIFHEFGHTLQMLSNSASYPSLGALNVPWDFVEVPSLLNERWFMTDEVLSRFALHHETHEPMPAELLAKLRRSLMQDRVFSATQSFLGTAVVDMRLHLLADGREIDAEAVEAEVIAELDMPQAMDLILYVPHAFHTFSPQYAAGVYTYLWSDIIAADIADAFLEAPGGLYDRGVARRYRSQILDIGNTKPVEEAFRDFRGRDPDPNALMRRFDLL
jgi:peptidyl-dipeptidase Dcp